MVRIASRLGAGRVVEGTILGSPDHLVITASLLNTGRDRATARARAEGPADSIAVMVDQLTAQLLASEAGEWEGRLGDNPSLPVVRAYLSGQAAVRDGRLWDAVQEFGRALDVDSSFAPAALGLLIVSVQIAGTDVERASRLAWAVRDRLSPADRAILTAQIGPRYPVAPTRAELLRAAETAVEKAPERPEAWYALGEAVFHDGPLLGLNETRPRAADLFRRAFALDTSRGTRRPFVEPLTHLMEMSLAAGDTVAARSWAGRVLADSAREGADFLRWRLALGTRDTVELEELRARFDQMDQATLVEIMDAGQILGDGLDDAERAGAAIEGKYGTDKEWALNVWVLRVLHLNLGRPAKAVSLTDRLPSPDRWLPHLRPLLRVTDGLFWEGDRAAAEQGVRQLASFAGEPLPDDAESRTVRANDLCGLGLWWVQVGDLARVDQTLSQFESVAVADSTTLAAGNKVVCTLMLKASLAVARRDPTTPGLLAELDSILLTGPPTVWVMEATIVSGRLHSAVGDHPKALEVFRRFADNGWQAYYLSTFLREQGREAALIGDTLGAIRAYRHYLALRENPEVSLKDEVARVRADLRRLEGGSRAFGSAALPE
jgi:tetratricopeptide (TPR) repeat protein